MDNRTNTIAGWVLGGCGLALALSIAGGMIYSGGRPVKMGYPIEGVEAEGGDAATPEVDVATLLPTADPAKGADVFKKCGACHTINQGGPNGIGPNLYGTLGEPIGQGKAGFAFSDALKGVGGNWDFEKMNAWLTSPRKFAPGTKMTFAGLSSAQDRANVLAYVNQQGSNLPLPKPPAPAAGAAASAGATSATGATPDKAAAAIKAATTGTQTADMANKGTPAMGAPSVDPNAMKQGAKAGK